MPKAKINSITHEVNRGSDYSREELEFIVAVDRYKTTNKRPFPTLRELFAILKTLGYRKEEASGPAPKTDAAEYSGLFGDTKDAARPADETVDGGSCWHPGL